MVNSHHGKVIWPDEKSEEYLCIQCNVDEEDRLGRMKIKDWEKNSAGVVSEVCKMLSVHYKYFALEVLTELKSGIRKMGVSNPESVLVSFEENKIAIAGETKYVDELSEKIKTMITSMEQHHDSRGQAITKIVKLEEHEMELFKEAKFLEHLKTVSISLENQNVILKGKRKMVNDSVLKVKEIIKSLPKQNIEGISMLERSLLRMNETTLHIKRMMTGLKVVAVWNVLEDGALVMYSQSAEELKTAITTLKSALKSTKIKVNTRIANYLRKGEGKAFLEHIEKKYSGRVKLNADREEVCIVSLNNVQQEIHEKVMKYLDSHSDVTEVLPLDPGVFRFIFSYKRNAIDTLVQQYKRVAVEIDIIDKHTRKGFMISGEKEGCKLAIVDLHAVVDTVARSDHDVDWPMFDQFLRSSKGIKELNKIELAEKCVIRISTDDTKVIPEKPRNSVLGECRIGNCKIEIMENDITEKVVEYIVNPTDSSMNNKHGLGRTLVDKGGFSIQKDCNDYIQGVPCLKDGDIFVGAAGCLPCRGIIHVVVPTWRGGNSNEESILNYVVTRCLIEADTRNSATIAFPPVGAGRLGYPRGIIAEIMMKAVKTYLIENGTETFLRHVYICDIDRDMLCLHVKAIEKGFGQTTVMMPELLGGDETDAKESDITGDYVKGITKEIVTGCITSQDTDVIANSTNLQLDLRIGTLSRLLVKEGGQEIVSEIKEKYPNGIMLGDIAETTGGNLKWKALFHGVLVKWDKGQGYADTVLRCFVQNCLFTAHKRQYASIAFPVLGAGALEFPPDQVAEIMFNAINSFEKEVPVSSLKCVRISIMSEDEKSLKAFEEYKSQCGKNRQLSRLSDISSRQSCQVESVFTESGGTDYNTTIGHVILSIEQGDLTTATTAVIVNSVPDDLNMETGKISRAIFRAAGKSIQHEANKYRKSFKQSGLVLTSSGRLLCQKIIHVKAKNSVAGWKKTVTKCLAEVEKSSLNSVSFPALGTGGKGFPPSEIAKTMMEAFQDYILGESYQGYLRNVRIIVYETKMVEEFTREAKASLENSPRKSFFLKFWERKPVEEPECSRMVFHIYTESPNGVTEVVRRIEDLHKEVNISVPETVLTKMSDTEISRLERIGETYGVYVFVSNEGLVISGYGKNVDIVKEKIHLEIDRK
ncbi:protein mono-ADP-ribosyltransferase PARP14-like [Mercenaria mercenaria]|uniref:protein mono-ADP-ribosyltransferase PARP14-like n=1 Tax=Mercenaria mercenaria TaxID=6596 RepID=UPI00234E46EE|nr:protein mono-ADP-ribosyltransferase PARP14-like [Mercenaria mercenaria]